MRDPRRRIGHNLRCNDGTTKCLETGAGQGATAVGEATTGSLESSRKGREFRRGGKRDPETEIGAENATEVLGTEARGGLGHPEASGEFGVGSTRGKARESDGETDGPGEAEGRPGGVAAVEQGVEEAAEPLEGGGFHAETKKGVVGVSPAEGNGGVRLRASLVALALAGATRGGGGDVGSGGEEVEGKGEEGRLGCGERKRGGRRVGEGEGEEEEKEKRDLGHEKGN